MRCNRAMHPVLALGCFLGLATVPALSQTQDGHVQMIMSKLPPQASTTYRAIKKRAGSVAVQVLTLTKTEMWSVPRDNKVEAVKKAAIQYGVVANQLAADWNHLFRSAPADMNDKQKSMLAQAASSKATMGVVAMMLPPRAGVVEYALTKDADAPYEAAKIILKLNERRRSR